MKAFFSYSHADAELVHQVARHVGRPFVSIDKISFVVADDLISAMERAVREASVFVFFASKASLSSAWANFELNEARYHQALQRIQKIVVVILDERIRPSDFPDWMTRSLFFQSRAPAPIARVVRRAIDDVIHGQQTAFFVGRSAETAEMQAAFVPPDGSAPTAIVAVRGLPGIGRRTLLERVARDSMSFQRILTVRVEVGDNANALAVKCADLIEASATPDETLTMAREIAGLQPEMATERLLLDLKKAVELNELIALYDEGGLLDHDGELAPSLRDIFRRIAKQGDVMVMLVTNRRPSWRESSELANTPVVDVGPLRAPESKQLLALMAKARGIDIPAADMSPLIEQVRGYPPAVRAMVQQVQTYGVQAAASAARRAAEYRPRPLTRYLDSLKLTEAERRILAILARNSPLPIELLTHFAGGGEPATTALINLIDASLVSPQETTSWYRISEPVIDYVIRTMPPCTADDYALVARELDQFLSRDRDSGAYLDLSRVFYRALVHSGKSAAPRAYSLMADWLKLAEDLYHQRDYDKSLELATLAHDAAPSVAALTWKIKCNVKRGEHSVAAEDIAALRRLGQVRESHFLRGFLERNRANYHEAVKYYERARAAGRGGLALERDLAECYFHTGDLERAMLHISEAQRRQSDNRYVVNLRIKIACRQRDEETARALLPLLDEVDTPVFASHRRARVEIDFGDMQAAYGHALQAVADSPRPPSEALSTLALCEIRTGRTKDASETLGRLEALYPKQRKDVTLGLRARLAIVERHFEDALGYCESFARRDSPEYMLLRRDALQGLLLHTNLSTAERRANEQIVAQINSQLLSRFGRTDWEIDTD